jgi:hypothetical protein
MYHLALVQQTPAVFVWGQGEEEEEEERIIIRIQDPRMRAQCNQCAHVSACERGRKRAQGTKCSIHTSERH